MQPTDSVATKHYISWLGQADLYTKWLPSGGFAILAYSFTSVYWDEEVAKHTVIPLYIHIVIYLYIFVHFYIVSVQPDLSRPSFLEQPFSLVGFWRR